MKIYKLQYLALKNLFRSRLKILQGVGFLKKSRKSGPVTSVPIQGVPKVRSSNFMRFTY